MFAIYYSMVDFFIHGVDLLGGYLCSEKNRVNCQMESVIFCNSLIILSK